MTHYTCPRGKQLPSQPRSKTSFPKIVRSDWSWAYLLVVNHPSTTATIVEKTDFSFVRTKVQRFQESI